MNIDPRNLSADYRYVLYCLYFVAGLFALIMFIKLCVHISNKNREKRHQREVRAFIRKLAGSRKAITPEELFELRKESKGFTGVYVIYNKTQDLVYVGQAQDVFQRCNNHFTGKGNGDIYADYKYGDEFIIRFASLKNSMFDSLDELEAYFIDKCDATEGYNRKKGNK